MRLWKIYPSFKLYKLAIVDFWLTVDKFTRHRGNFPQWKAGLVILVPVDL